MFLARPDFAESEIPLSDALRTFATQFDHGAWPALEVQASDVLGTDPSEARYRALWTYLKEAVGFDPDILPLLINPDELRAYYLYGGFPRTFTPLASGAPVPEEADIAYDAVTDTLFIIE